MKEAWLGIVFAAFLTALPSAAEEAPPRRGNPYQDFWSFRLENRLFLESGSLSPSTRSEYVLRSISILPAKVSDDWMLISVPIVRLVSRPVPLPGGFQRQNGLADIQYLGLLSPAKEHGLNWGVGPTAILPTATRLGLGAGKWQLGPTAAGMYVAENWHAAVVLAQLWSVAGDSTRAETSTFQGYFNFTRNLPNGWQIGSSPEVVVNWKAPEGNRVVLPIGLGVGKTVAIGSQPVNFYVEGQRYLVTPDAFGPEWLFIFRITPFIPRL